MMRYVIFKIPLHRIVTRGGWDDFWYWTDDLQDARTLIARDPKTVLQHALPGIPVQHTSIYQIVDLTTGEMLSSEGGASRHTPPHSGGGA
jgi:hypothetical protein